MDAGRESKRGSDGYHFGLVGLGQFKKLIVVPE